MAPYVLFWFVLIEFRVLISFEVFKTKAEILQRGRKCAQGEKPAGEWDWGSATLGEKGGARCVAALSRISAQRITVKGDRR